MCFCFAPFADGQTISDMVTLGNTTAALSRWSLLNTSLVEVNFHRQRAGLLALLWLFHGHGDHRTQVVRVDFVGVVQKLFVSIDAQLQRHKEGNVRKQTHNHKHSSTKLCYILLSLDLVVEARKDCVFDFCLVAFIDAVMSWWGVCNSRWREESFCRPLSL